MQRLLCMGMVATLCLQQLTDVRWHQAETVPLEPTCERQPLFAPLLVREVGDHIV